MQVDPDQAFAFIAGMGFAVVLYCFVSAGIAYRRHRRELKAKGRLSRMTIAQTLEQGRVRTAMD